MSKPIRVADYIAQTIERQGTDAFFMLSGGMMMHLLDAFGRIPSIRYYCNHHEQACAMAADAYARESGKLGLCMATSGPGATNILTGLVGAYQDSVPVLFLTGQCKRKETVRGRGIKGLRQCGFLEVDIIPIVESVTKYAAFVDNPRDIRMHLEKAIHLATTGRPGPVLLDLPLDVQAALIIPDELPGYQPEQIHPPVPAGELDRVFHAIQNARRPIILAGHGVRSAGLVETFQQLVEKWQVPVATSLMAKDLLPENHPLFVGHPGPRANRGANFAVQSADVIVSMGCSLHIQTVGYEGDLFAPNALKIQIDLDPALLEREHIGANWKFAWDLHDYLPMLIDKVRKPWGGEGADAWRAACHQWKQNYSSRKENHRFGAETDLVNLYEFIDLLSDELSGQETILTDAGQPHPILGQAFRPKAGQRYLNPGSFAEMGYALPASMGVAVAAPAKSVIAVIGDGSLQTNIQELQTLVHHQFNVKLFVINNDGYASIRNTQKTFFNGFFVGSTPSSGVTMPNTEKICRAYGLAYERCENRGALRDTIRRVLAQSGPVLCEVMAQIDQRILPAVPSQLLPDGSMRSKALHEMAPEIGVTFAELTRALPDFKPHPDLPGSV
jgi:acetolactate synthase-1/2/3 large subunit